MMKHKTWFSLFVTLGLALGAAWLVGLPTLAQGPVNTTFTYQGRLRSVSGGTYVTGNCDFQFMLWDDPIFGSQLGTLERTNVAVKDGYFTVALDFGDVFNGGERYMQIAVCCPTGSCSYDTLAGRAKLNPSPYTLAAKNAPAGRVPWSNVTGKPPGFADDVDNVVTYTNGFGLKLSADNQFSVITSTLLNTVTLQRRVVARCTGAQTIQGINADGSVRCATARVPYAAGEGVYEYVNPLIGVHEFSYDANVVQERIKGTCGSGQVIRQIGPKGAVYCEPIPGGTIGAVYAGDGLAGGGDGGVVTLTVAPLGITTTMIATGAVNGDKIAAGGVDNAAIADNAVTSAGIADGGISLADINGNGCKDNQMMAYVSDSWQCMTDTVGYLTAGDGISIVGTTISARVADGIKLDPDTHQIAVDFAAAGTADIAARSDHNHDDRYPKLTATPQAGDVIGSYTSGFTVTKINGIPLAGTFNATNDILKYDGSNWTASDPSIGLDIMIVSADIQDNGYAQCPDGYAVVGGGCDCSNSAAGGDDTHVEDAYPESSNAFFCNCGKNDKYKVYAVCIKTGYGP
jgi:hypothetical protein